MLQRPKRTNNLLLQIIVYSFGKQGFQIFKKAFINVEKKDTGIIA